MWSILFCRSEHLNGVFSALCLLLGFYVISLQISLDARFNMRHGDSDEVPLIVVFYR